MLTCFESATNLLKQVLILVELHILYYLWDTCYLVTAYSAVMLGKVKHLSIEPFRAISHRVALHY
jgi:hypothetical protein